MRLGFVGFNRLELDTLLGGLRFQTSHVFGFEAPLPTSIALDAVVLSTTGWQNWVAAHPLAHARAPTACHWVVLSVANTPPTPPAAGGVLPHWVDIGLTAQAPLEVLQRWLNQQVGSTATRWPQRLQRERSAFSNREHEVLALLSQGLSNDEISAALGIRVPTVKTYLRRIFERTGALNRAHAVALYAERQSVTFPPQARLR